MRLFRIAAPNTAHLAPSAYLPPSFATTIQNRLVKALLFWSAAALLLFGQLMILRAWWAGRTPAAGTARRPRAREFVWIALPVLVLSATLAFTWRAHNAQSAPNQESNAHSEHTP